MWEVVGELFRIRCGDFGIAGMGIAEDVTENDTVKKTKAKSNMLEATISLLKVL